MNWIRQVVIGEGFEAGFDCYIHFLKKLRIVTVDMEPVHETLVSPKMFKYSLFKDKVN